MRVRGLRRLSRGPGLWGREVELTAVVKRLRGHCAVQEAFELSAAEWVAICEGSIDGSWCGQERKEELRARLGSVSEEWVGRCGT